MTDFLLLGTNVVALLTAIVLKYVWLNMKLRNYATF